jgi:hypothetical protein
MLIVASDFCNLEEGVEIDQNGNTINFSNSKKGLPPPLTDSLRLDEISQLWQQEGLESANEHENSCNHLCLFSFFSNQQGIDSVAALEEKLSVHLQGGSGWFATDSKEYGKKLSFVPDVKKEDGFPVAIFLFPKIATSVVRLTIFYTKSFRREVGQVGGFS